VFFGIVITAMFFIGARWADHDAPDAEALALPPAVAPAGGAALPLLMAALSIAAVAWPAWLGASADAPRPSPGPVLPAALAPGWTADDSALTAWRPRYEGATLEQHRGYRGPQGQGVGVHLLYYRDQAPGRKLVSSVNILVHSEDPSWNLVQQAVRPAGEGAAPGAPASWLSATVLGDAASGKHTLKLRRAYWVGGRWTHSDFQAKLWEAWVQWRGEPDDAAAVILSAEDNSAGSADRTLDAFTSANFDPLERALTQARGR
jgi:EpsI family protein